MGPSTFAFFDFFESSAAALDAFCCLDLTFACVEPRTTSRLKRLWCLEKRRKRERWKAGGPLVFFLLLPFVRVSRRPAPNK